ncbi:MAG: M23 family metallopeptidase [Treponema sp.]|nr:M23 family metallopeptidase [Treponema sp.]MBR4386905.1 M23 family metallopeptidase [Treponema sp.]
MKRKLFRHHPLSAATLVLAVIANIIFAQGISAQEPQEEEEVQAAPSSQGMLAYPLIESLDSRNVLFKQYQQAVQEASMAEIRGDLPSALEFYSYKAQKKDTAMLLSSRCAIRYDSLVTLNSIAENGESLEGRTLILPTANGLYIPHEPQTPIEILLAKEHSKDLLEGKYPTLIINGKKFYFMKGVRFSPAQRAYFLIPGMRLPLDKSVLTSSFGMRISPISGKWKFHKGIDMAAPLGSNIYACKSGTATTVVKMNPTYGNYVVLRHDDGMSSLYAHMNDISVTKDQKVSTGQIIGHVGTTGMSTGPHLHFEIHLNGEAQDPQKYLRN